MSRTDTEALASRFGDGMVVLERGELLSVLRAVLTDADIRTSAEVCAVDMDGTDLTPADSPREVSAHAVLGADAHDAARHRAYAG